MEKSDLDKIINEMSNKHGMCFTDLEVTLLESVVLEEALFNNKQNEEVMKELNDRII